MNSYVGLFSLWGLVTLILAVLVFFPFAPNPSRA